MKTNRWFLALFVSIAFLIVSCSGSGKTTLQVGSEVPIPSGYKLVAVSAWGGYSEHPTFYCQEDRTGRVYTCNDGNIGPEVVLPEGYSLAEASAWGLYSNHETFFCRLNGTNKIFVCNPK